MEGITDADEPELFLRGLRMERSQFVFFATSCIQGIILDAMASYHHLANEHHSLLREAAAVTLQKNIRRFLVENWFNDSCRCIHTVQRVCHGFLLRKEIGKRAWKRHHTQCNAIFLFQRIGRALYSRRLLTNLNAAQRWKRLGDATSTIQRGWRGATSRIEVGIQRTRLHAATAIQRWTRNCVTVSRWRNQRRVARAEREHHCQMLLRADEHRERTLLQCEAISHLRDVYTRTKRMLV